MGRLGAQELGEAMTGFAATGMRYGDGMSSTEQRRRRREKQGRRKGEERRRCRPYSAAKAHGDDAQQLLHASTTPKMATVTTGTLRKLTDGEVSPAVTVHHIYRIATRLISQITPKFIW